MTVAILPPDLGHLMIIGERSAAQQILVEIAKAMEQTNYQPLRHVGLRYDAGTVILRGVVPTYFLKQLAQVTAMGVSGVDRIDNQLRVAADQAHQPKPPLDAERPIYVFETSLPQIRAMPAYA